MECLFRNGQDLDIYVVFVYIYIDSASNWGEGKEWGVVDMKVSGKLVRERGRGGKREGFLCGMQLGVINKLERTQQILIEKGQPWCKTEV